MKAALGNGHRFMAVLAASALFASQIHAAEFSSLWGEAGERWTPQSRLPDFSFAGYECGQKEPPNLPRAVSVRDFGAKGDGESDDTAAFLLALERTTNGAIEIPAGRYRITQPLEITRPGVVLRGAGSVLTRLFFPKSLESLNPAPTTNTGGRRTSSYSWSGGLIAIRGNIHSAPLASITAEAARGDKAVEVDSAMAFQPGQRIEIFQADRPDNSLAIHLYSGDSGSVSNLRGRATMSLICRVTAVEGNRIRLDRPLRCNLEARWSPQVRSFIPSVTHSGVENLFIEFPPTPYRGHFTEAGFNALALSGVVDCWVRNVHVVNADSGMFISGAFNTVQGLVLDSLRSRDSQGCVGHHGVCVSGNDNWISGFNLKARYLHDIGVTRPCSGNVFSGGHGVDLSLDHHRFAPFENLFTDLDAGAGKRLWKSGGGADLGKNCGARGTFWNIRASRRMSYPPREFGPRSLNIIGLHTAQPSVTRADGKWFEAITPSRLEPQDLHEAQLKLRLR